MTNLDGDVIEAPISVYFDLLKGDTAELDVIAEAAIAWTSALKKLFASVEPGADVRVHLVDGDEGSLWLNTLLKFVESKFEQIAKGSERYPRQMALARGLAIIVVATPLQVTAENVWNAVLGDDPEVAKLSAESQQQIRGIFEQVITERIAETEKERFAKAVSKDKRILGVGVSATPDRRPALVVSREDVQAYLDREILQDDIIEVRKRNDTLNVLLVSPVLEDAERSWKFRQPGMPEFGAVMRDRGFLAAIARREVHEQMRFGIQMRVEIEFKEHLEGGVWLIDERSVVRVISPIVDRSELPF